MKRKVLSLLLCGLIACSMLTACGGSNSSNNAEVFIVKYKCRKLQTKNVGRCNYIL